MKMLPSELYAYFSEFNPKIKFTILEEIFYEKYYSHFNQNVCFLLKIDIFSLYNSIGSKITDL